MLKRPSPLTYCDQTGSCAHDVALALAKKVAFFATYTVAPLVRLEISGRAKLRDRLKEFPCERLKLEELYTLMAEEAVAAAARSLQSDDKGAPQRDRLRAAKAPGRRGAPKLPIAEARKRKALIEQYRQSRQSKKDFCEQAGIESGKLEEALAWERTRRKREQNTVKRK
jgi:hypothetical protein